MSFASKYPLNFARGRDEPFPNKILSSLLEMCFLLINVKKAWSMHMQSQHGCYISNWIFKLTTWNVSVLTMVTLYWMRWFHSSIILRVQTKNLHTKVLTRLLKSFGKNLNTLLTELALTAINQVALKMMTPFLDNLTSGMRCIPFLLLKSLDWWPVKLLQSGWDWDLQSGLAVMSKSSRMGRGQILVANHWRKGPFCIHLKAWRGPVIEKFGCIKRFRSRCVWQQWFEVITFFSSKLFT